MKHPVLISCEYFSFKVKDILAVTLSNNRTRYIKNFRYKTKYQIELRISYIGQDDVESNRLNSDRKL
jgi:hypothetical protein